MDIRLGQKSAKCPSLMWWLYTYGLYTVDPRRVTVSRTTNNAMERKRWGEDEIEVIYKEKLFIMWRKCKDLKTISIGDPKWNMDSRNLLYIFQVFKLIIKKDMRLHHIENT